MKPFLRSALMSSMTAVALLCTPLAAQAETPKDTLVMAYVIDDMISLDPAENTRHASRISRSDSRIPVYVVPTDEELMIAQHTLTLLMNRQSPNQKRERVS